MKNKIFVVLGMIFLFTFVSADIFSVNSGGSSGIIVNPSEFIEGFFFSQNNLPVVDDVLLFSSFGGNTTNENLSVSYFSFDSDGDNLTNITDWRVDSSSINVLNMPFDTRIISRDAGAIRDYSSFGNNGTLGGGTVDYLPTYEENCQIGGCYSFDGVNDFIQIPDDDSLDLISEASFSLWIKVDGYGTYYATHLINKWAGTATANYVLYFFGNYQGNNNQGVIRVYANRGGSWGSVSGGDFIPLGNWTHIAWSYNSLLGGQLYVDGEPIGGLTGSGDLAVNNANLKIDSSGFNGSIDNVQIFNRALSAEQIKEIYEAGLGGHNIEKFVSQETNVGETWQVAVTANDKFGDSETVLSNEVEIINNPPLAPEPVLVSADLSNESDANLNCSFDVIDGDSPFLDIEVNWLKDGVSQVNNTYFAIENGTNYLDELDSSYLTLGDVWMCSVRIYDSYEYSSWGDSNELEIIDITDPIVNIISPEPINYSTVNIDFNVSVIENENVSMCFYDLDGLGNVSMSEVNDSYFWSEPILGPGPHDVWFYCNDTSNNWGSNFTNFSIDNDAAIAILLSENLSDAIRWNVFTLPADDLDALGNNLNGTTDYYLNISATNTLVDLYVRADGDLFNSGGDVIGLGNETFSVNYSDATVPGGPAFVMGTNYTLIGQSLGDSSTIYMKFYLDAPVAQAAGQYFNQLNFKAVREGQNIN